MSHPIRVTPEIHGEILQEFVAALSKTKACNGLFSFTKTFSYDPSPKTTLYFTTEAWLKTLTLLQGFSTEVEWHGLAKRNEDGLGYVVYDILVPPHEVSSVTAHSDQEKYEMWLMSLDDSQFNNLRMHGHSHVNMSTSPSGDDQQYRRQTAAVLPDDSFYIFMILNKSLSREVQIYDIQENICYDSDDIDIVLCDCDTDLEEFLQDAKAKAVVKPVTTYGADYKAPRQQHLTSTIQDRPSASLWSDEEDMAQFAREWGYGD